MRPLAALLLLALPPAVASAQPNERIAFLARQLASASDARLRAQSALMLAATKDPEAVGPLCAALSDSDSVVRTAVAKALGELRQQKGVGCLERLRSDPSGDVQLAAAKALEALGGGGKALAVYVALEPITDATGTLPPDVLRLAEESLRGKLSAMGALLAPAGEPRGAAAAVVRQKKLKGFLLLLELHPNGPGGLRVVALCSTYPERALQGQVSARASGGTPAALVKALIPRVVDEAADEFEWSR